MAHTTFSHFLQGLDFFLTISDGKTHQMKRATITFSTIPIIIKMKGHCLSKTMPLVLLKQFLQLWADLYSFTFDVVKYGLFDIIYLTITLNL